MIKVFYNSKDFLDWANNISYDKKILNSYSPKSTREINILETLQKIVNSKNAGQVYDIIIHANQDFKQEFNYVPVRDAVAYFKGALPTIDENKITKFIRKIAESQNIELTR